MKKSAKTMKLNTSHYAKCRTLMLKFKNRHRIRFFLTSVILFANCYFHVITLPILYYGNLDRGSALLWGMFAFLINLVIFVTVFFHFGRTPETGLPASGSDSCRFCDRLSASCCRDCTGTAVPVTASGMHENAVDSETAGLSVFQ